MTSEQRVVLRNLMDGEADDQYRVTMISYNHYSPDQHLTVMSEMHDVIERKWFRHADVYDREGATHTTRSVEIRTPAWAKYDRA